jgi:hypothetical protein
MTKWRDPWIERFHLNATLAVFGPLPIAAYSYYGPDANAHRGRVRKAGISPFALRMAEERTEYFS